MKGANCFGRETHRHQDKRTAEVGALCPLPNYVPLGKVAEHAGCPEVAEKIGRMPPVRPVRRVLPRDYLTT